MHLALLAIAFSAATVQLDSGLPSYTPRPVDHPKDRGYLLPDGAIRIIGTDAMKTILSGFNELFVQSHPGFKFTMQLKGGYVALPEITHGVSAFGPIAREVTAVEAIPYEKIVGEAPLAIRIAHGTVSSQTRTAPLAVYVNKTNPIEKLTVEEAARIFTTGAPNGDLTYWGQLGLTGEWASRPIHPIGTPEDSGFGSFMVKHKMGARPFTPAYEVLLSSLEIIKRVGEDPAAIGYCALAFGTSNTRMLAIAEKKDGYYSRASAADVMSGRYPYDRYVFIVVRRVPGESIDSFVKEYLRLVLSREGQRIIALEPNGYLPLNANEAAQELAKLN